MGTTNSAPTAPAPRAARRRARGFTLVELMVAMSAGLMVATGAFLLARNATSFFQHEARISATQLAATMGLSRLTSDIQRAGFNSSPNVRDEALNQNQLCGQPAGWPDGMFRLASVAIERHGSLIDHAGELDQSVANGFSPDAIILGGSFHTSDEFFYTAIDGCPAACTVTLSVTGSAMRRLAQRSALGGGLVSGMIQNEIFRVGRILRIAPLRDTYTMYGVIDATDVIGEPPNPASSVTIRLSPVPTLPVALNPETCGVPIGGDLGGGHVNPVSRVRWDIRSLAGDPNYSAVVAPISPAVTGDNGRTELVRVELDARNAEIADTRELVAEYAVDLKFGITVASDPMTNPGLDRYPIATPEHNEVYTFGGELTDINARPHRIRSVQIRLSTRTRAPDRTNHFSKQGSDGRKLRFLIPGIVPGVNVADQDPVDLPPPGSPPVYARMRTLYADVSLSNQANLPW